MRATDLEYDLPAELIARVPVEPRDGARLLVVERASESITHATIRDLPALLGPRDRVVINDTRVIPARVIGQKQTGGAVELLFVSRASEDSFVAMLGGKRLRPGTTISLPEGRIARIVAATGDGLFNILLAPRQRRRCFRSTESFHGRRECHHLALAPADDWVDWLDRIGTVPLPPYLGRAPTALDSARYQTIFATHPGSVAAPTAGLHLTTAVIERMRARGTLMNRVTLHVGPGTFLPIRTDLLADHRMLPERFTISSATASALNSHLRENGRIVAVGTTVVRALESAALPDGGVAPRDDATNLFIHDATFRFRVVGALLTNFHLPRSTLLSLVYTFGGRELIRCAYAEAVRSRYRFYSYGDAMLII